MRILQSFKVSGQRICGFVLLGALLPGNGYALSDFVQPAPGKETIERTFLQGIYRWQFAPRAAKFNLTVANLRTAIELMCRAPSAESTQTARRAWTDAMLAWESAGAILVGPLLARHTSANIDFWPTRPNIIEGAMRGPPSDTAALRRISVAARGLPALEWLLWAPGESPPAANEKGCRYALVLAQDLVEEAQALNAKFATMGDNMPAPSDASKLLGELVNQSTGAIEVLRRKRLLNPVTIHNPKAFARSLSDQAQPALIAQWDSIRDLLVGEHGDEKWTLSMLLHESGIPSAAARLQTAVDQSDSAVRAAAPTDPGSVRRAADTLMSLRRAIELGVAPALGISISFSDFDGD